jgi:hypothetical protein
MFGTPLKADIQIDVAIGTTHTYKGTLADIEDWLIFKYLRTLLSR